MLAMWTLLVLACALDRPGRDISLQKLWCNPHTTTRILFAHRGKELLPRSMGSTEGGCGWDWVSSEDSHQIFLSGPLDPIAEVLVLVALFLEVGNNASDVLSHFIGNNLVALELASEVWIQVHGTAQVNLETFNAVAVSISDGLSLESDVGNLGACTRVRATVQCNLDGNIQIAEALFQFVDKLNCS